jgi:hypothetical protein
VHLLLILLSIVVDDVVEAKLVDALGGGDNAQPVTELLFLKELLRPGDIKQALAIYLQADEAEDGVGGKRTGT